MKFGVNELIYARLASTPNWTLIGAPSRPCGVRNRNFDRISNFVESHTHTPSWIRRKFGRYCPGSRWCSRRDWGSRLGAVTVSTRLTLHTSNEYSTSNFLPKRRMESEPHCILHGVAGGLYHFCTCLFFWPLCICFRQGTRKTLWETNPRSWLLHPLSKTLQPN